MDIFLEDIAGILRGGCRKITFLLRHIFLECDVLVLIEGTGDFSKKNCFVLGDHIVINGVFISLVLALVFVVLVQ